MSSWTSSCFCHDCFAPHLKGQIADCWVKVFCGWGGWRVCEIGDLWCLRFVINDWCLDANVFYIMFNAFPSHILQHFDICFDVVFVFYIITWLHALKFNVFIPIQIGKHVSLADWQEPKGGVPSIVRSWSSKECRGLGCQKHSLAGWTPVNFKAGGRQSLQEVSLTVFAMKFLALQIAGSFMVREISDPGSFW